jgi:hypothetical protein
MVAPVVSGLIKWQIKIIKNSLYRQVDLRKICKFAALKTLTTKK